MPAARSRLLAGVQAEQLDAAAGLEHPAYVAEPIDSPGVDAVASQGWPVRGYSLDLTDGFYQVKSERMASLFGLGESMRVSEVEAFLGRRIPELYEDSEGVMLATDPDEVVEAAFLGVPMGWPWSIHFCNEAISHAMRVALRKAGLPPILLGDRQQASFFHRGCPVTAPYVDNLNVVALDEAYGQKVFGLLEEELQKRGFVVRDRVAGEARFEFRGMVLEGRSGVLKHKPRRTWRLWMAITALIARRRSSGDAMRVALSQAWPHVSSVRPRAAPLGRGPEPVRLREGSPGQGGGARRARVRGVAGGASPPVQQQGRLVEADRAHDLLLRRVLEGVRAP